MTITGREGNRLDMPDPIKITPARLARSIEEVFTEFAEADPRFRVAHGIHPELSGKWASYVPLRVVRKRFEGTVSKEAFKAAVDASSLTVVIVSIPREYGKRPAIVNALGTRPGRDIRCLRQEGWVRPARAPSPNFERLMQHLKRVRDILIRTYKVSEPFENNYRRLCGLTERVTADLELLAGETLEWIERTHADHDAIIGFHRYKFDQLHRAKVYEHIQLRNLNGRLRRINNKNRRIQ